MGGPARGDDRGAHHGRCAAPARPTPSGTTVCTVACAARKPSTGKEAPRSVGGAYRRRSRRGPLRPRRTRSPTWPGAPADRPRKRRLRRHGRCSTYPAGSITWVGVLVARASIHSRRGVVEGMRASTTRSRSRQQGLDLAAIITRGAEAMRTRRRSRCSLLRGDDRIDVAPEYAELRDLAAR